MSDKPLSERLQIKRGRTLAIVGAPLGLALGLDGTAALAEADIVLAFAADRAWLEAWLAADLARSKEGALLWLAYAKLTSRLSRDLDRDVIRGLAPAFGLDTVAQIAIDADWSALRLKRAREAGAPPST